MAIPVYYLRTKSGGIGFAFDQGGKHTVYTYQAIDLFDWRGDRRGRVTKTDTIDRGAWIESSQILTTSLVNLLAYDTHIISWAQKAGTYSVFDDLGATAKMFAEETIRFFLSHGDRTSYLTAPLVTTHHIEYKSRVRIDVLQIGEVEEWFRMMHSLEYSEESLLQIIAESGQYYYCVIIEETDIRFYQLLGVTVSTRTGPLSITPLPLSPTVRVTAVGVDATAVTSTPNVVNTTSSNNSGLIIIVLLFTILIVLLVIAVLILEYDSEAELIGTNPIGSIPSVIPL